MGALAATRLLGLAGLALLGVGAGLLLYLEVAHAGSGVRRALGRYVEVLDRELRFQLSRTSGRRIARVQLALLAALALGVGLLGDPFFVVLMPLVAIVPYTVLRRRHELRVVRLEEQLDSWLLLLSNSLKAVPSIGEALAASGKLARPPISQEIDLLLKEVQLGSPIDEAVLSMGRRVDSPIVSGALATILIARQTGGDLPRLLEGQAATLREIARLEGVVRAKTAEGRSQAWVLSFVPFVLLALLYRIDPHWLAPLTRTPLGYAIIGASILLWVLAVVSARKILAVDV